MAYLGSIGNAVDTYAVSTLDHIGAHNIVLNPIGAIDPYTQVALPWGEDWGVFSGTVSAGGLPAARTIMLMRRDSGKVDTVVASSVSGAFSGRVPYKTVEYVAIALGGTGENGAVLDKVVAV